MKGYTTVYNIKVTGQLLLLLTLNVKHIKLISIKILTLTCCVGSSMNERVHESYPLVCVN